MLLLLSIALCVATIQKELVDPTNTGLHWMGSIQLVSYFLCLKILSTLLSLLFPCMPVIIIILIV